MPHTTTHLTIFLFYNISRTLSMILRTVVTPSYHTHTHTCLYIEDMWVFVGFCQSCIEIYGYKNLFFLLINLNGSLTQNK